MVRSTIQRFGGTTNLCRSDRFTISRLTGRRRSAARPGTWRLASAVGVELQQEGIEAEQRAHRQHAAIAVLNVGSWMMACISRPWVSTGTWRFLPLIFVPAS
jgi:hypothetical protein